MVKVYIGLGSNVGDRLKNIRTAVSKLNSSNKIKVVNASSIWETEPIGNKDQNWYLNAVTVVETDQSPHDLLKVCKKIEKDIGRKKTYKWGPREIDLDILMFNKNIVKSKNLLIPHPEILNRAFVVYPLVEVYPEIDKVFNIEKDKIMRKLDRQIVKKTNDVINY